MAGASVSGDADTQLAPVARAHTDETSSGPKTNDAGQGRKALMPVGSLVAAIFVIGVVALLMSVAVSTSRPLIRPPASARMPFFRAPRRRHPRRCRRRGRSAWRQLPRSRRRRPSRNLCQLCRRRCSPLRSRPRHAPWSPRRLRSGRRHRHWPPRLRPRRRPRRHPHQSTCRSLLHRCCRHRLHHHRRSCRRSFSC